jgi:hypothetical protein
MSRRHGGGGRQPGVVVRAQAPTTSGPCMRPRASCATPLLGQLLRWGCQQAKGLPPWLAKREVSVEQEQLVNLA